MSLEAMQFLAQAEEKVRQMKSAAAADNVTEGTLAAKQ